MQNNVKKQVNSGVSQFELTQKLLQNLYKFNLTPTAKMVIMYLSSCYNPKHAEMFPKQRTIADKLGVSEASVIRAICELHKEGLIISERKYTNRYKYTSKFLISLGILDNKMQVENSQNESKETCNLQPVLREPKKEHKKEPTNVDDYKILKEYAIKHNAKNVHAYINFLKSSGAAMQIVQEYQQSKRRSEQMKNKTEEYLKSLEYAKQNCAVVPGGWFDEIRNKLK